MVEQAGASAEDLATALIQMCKENLANLHPHPIYAKFYYSHPPVVERVQNLRKLAD
jgi:STE24 endopeptidase